MAAPYDVAVVLTARSDATLADSLRSAYGQTHAGRIQVLLGLDGQISDAAALEALLGEAPAHVDVAVVDPGRSGTALRTMLAYIAHAPRIAFLEGGNLWRAEHLSRLSAAVAGRPWAFSRRAFVHAGSGATLAVDDGDSAGPPGPVAPDCLMLTVAACEPVFRHWAEQGGDAAAARALAAIPGWGVSPEATVLVRLDPDAPGHRDRLAMLVRRLGRDFAGYRQFDAGDFAAAAASFDALFVLDRPSPDGLVWRYVARARSGEREAARAELAAALDPSDPAHRAVRDLMLSGGLPRRMRERLGSGRPIAASDARLAFFAAQAALLAGDDAAARDLLARAADGPPGTREAEAARIEQTRQGWASTERAEPN